MDLKFRLVCRSRSNYPSGIYSGTDRQYVLQAQIRGDRWRTCPIVEWEELSKMEQTDIANDLRPTDSANGDKT